MHQAHSPSPATAAARSCATCPAGSASISATNLTVTPGREGHPMAQIRVMWDDAAIRLDTQRPGGPVDRAMSRLADEAVTVMKQLAPVYSGPQRGPRPGHPRQAARRSGTLRASIRKFRQADGSYLIGPTDQVAPGVFLGVLIESGTRPHAIRSTGPWPLYNAATGQAFGRAVRHPGTRPRPFIRPAARALNGRTLRID